MPLECPNCHRAERVTKLRQPFRFTFGQLVLGLLGGFIGGVLWALGQENKYRCEGCERIFFSHTRSSRIFCALAVLVYLVIGVVLLYGLFLLFKR